MRSVSVKRWFHGLFLAALLPACLQAQEGVTVTVTILDALSGDPIQGVLASVEGFGFGITTDSAGVLVLSEIPLGSYQLTLQQEGYGTESGRLTVDKAGGMVIRMIPVGGPGTSEMSRIEGTVRDLDGGRRLEGVAVRFSALNLSRETNSNGRFTFENVPPGEHSLHAAMLGYASREETVVVEGGKIITFDLSLSVEPIELPGIEVSVEGRSLDLELSGFYDRRDATSGYFISREKIEERAPLYTTDLFRGVAGIKVIPYDGLRNAVLLTGSRSISFGPRCFPVVWMDGQMVHQGSAGPLKQGPAFVDQFIHPDDIAGIEVYNSPASMPVQYNLHAACGAIVIWTRHGKGGG